MILRTRVREKKREVVDLLEAAIDKDQVIVSLTEIIGSSILRAEGTATAEQLEKIKAEAFENAWLLGEAMTRFKERVVLESFGMANGFARRTKSKHPSNRL